MKRKMSKKELVNKAIWRSNKWITWQWNKKIREIIDSPKIEGPHSFYQPLKPEQFQTFDSITYEGLTSVSRIPKL